MNIHRKKGHFENYIMIYKVAAWAGSTVNIILNLVSFFLARNIFKKGL